MIIKPQFVAVHAGQSWPEFRWVWHDLVSLVPFHEGGVEIRDVVRREVLTRSGTSRVGLGASGGYAYHITSTSTHKLAWPTTGWWPTAAQTLLSWYEKTDATNRATGLGTTDGTAAERCGGHWPWSDGTIYCDYGGNTGNNRISFAPSPGLGVGDHRLISAAGPDGFYAMLDQAIGASHGNAITRTDTGRTYAIGQGNGVTSNDLVKHSLFALWSRQFRPEESAFIQRDMRWMERRFVRVAVKAPLVTLEGEVTSTATVRIAQTGESTSLATARVAQTGETSDLATVQIALGGETTSPVTTRIAQTGESSDLATVRIAQRGTATAAATALIALAGAVTSPATAQIAQTGESTSLCTFRIGLRGEVTDTATVRIAQTGESTSPATARIAQTGESSDLATFQISVGFPGEITDLATARIAQTGESTSLATVRIAQTGESSDLATVRIALGGETTSLATVRIAQTGESTSLATVRIAQTGESTSLATFRISVGFPGESTSLATVRIAQTGESSDLATVRIALGGETTSLATVRIAQTGESTSLATTRVAQTGESTSLATFRISLAIVDIKGPLTSTMVDPKRRIVPVRLGDRWLVATGEARWVKLVSKSGAARKVLYHMNSAGQPLSAAQELIDSDVQVAGYTEQLTTAVATGAEVLLGLSVPSFPALYFPGLVARNSDGAHHALVSYVSDGIYTVEIGWEDFPNAGMPGYDDLVVRVSGVRLEGVPAKNPARTSTMTAPNHRSTMEPNV